MPVSKLKQMSKKLCDTMEVFTHKDRVAMFYYLKDKEKSVSEIGKELGIRQPSLSQQLTILKQKGLVSTRREGRNIYYTSKTTKETEILEMVIDRYFKD